MNALSRSGVRVVAKTSESERELIAARLQDAAPIWAAFPLIERARVLLIVADALAEAQDELVGIAMAETGLSEARLIGELKRTVLQIRLFADVVTEGEFLDVRIDEADSDFALGIRPDLRRYHVPIGPVLNFAASNFPFAFSIAGGDTTSALAAGCPVVVKAHSGHPRLSLLTGRIVSNALMNAGAPDGVFDVIVGQEAGVAMLKDPRILAASFTGSVHVGQLLTGIAASRKRPIPFYGELGSVNPVFITSDAIAEDPMGIVDGFSAALSGSAGQLCTKPGFVFLPSDNGLEEDLVARLSRISEHRLLYPGIARSYGERREAILKTPGIKILHEGFLRFDGDGNGWATPTLVSINIDELILGAETLLEEAFGPLAILVEYAHGSDLVACATLLFAGNLTGTVHAAKGEDTLALRSLIDWITGHAGRVLFGGWPTGVSVTPAMQHGGPWPATTNDSGTSVGTAAIRRFLRPVAYQNVPQNLLPEPLRDANLWSVPQIRNFAGQSRHWGELSQKPVD